MLSRKNLMRAVSPLCVFLPLAAAAPADAAKVVIIPGAGFSDATPAAPVGGNTGTTVGAQRLIAFQAAADVWGAQLASPVDIRVDAQFSPLSCSANSGTLGSAGPTTVHNGFANAPRASTWYTQAEANSIAGVDLDTSNNDIATNFNSNLGTPGCLETSGWYYGLDRKPPSGKFDFVTILIHELGHGLGFLSLVNLTTGAKFNGLDDAYMINLENHGASPPDYPSMTNAQRVTASTSNGNLHWTGPNLRAASNLLTAGAVGDHVRIYAPSVAAPGSSVSHFDTVLTPNQIMEPFYTVALMSPILERPLFRDLSWKLVTPRVDFSGEGRSDILWRDTSNGNAVVSLMNGAAVVSSSLVASLPNSWVVQGTGDFNFDGRSDILWRDTGNGNTVLSLMNGPTVTSSTLVASLPLSWIVSGIGDFDADGRADILWRDTSNGNAVVSLMNGAVVRSSTLAASLPTTWLVAATGDFNGDGKADILWRDTTNGNVVVSLMNGAVVISSTLVAALPLSWTVAGTGDFNADGRRDILWRDTSNGNAVVSLMNGATVVSSTLLASLPLTWSVAQVSDFNSDGKTDVLWRDSSNGNAVVSLVNGTTITSSTLVAALPNSWVVQGTNAN
jgi:hypothetical protein